MLRRHHGACNWWKAGGSRLWYGEFPVTGTREDYSVTKLIISSITFSSHIRDYASASCAASPAEFNHLQDRAVFFSPSSSLGVVGIFFAAEEGFGWRRVGCSEDLQSRQMNGSLLDYD